MESINKPGAKIGNDNAKKYKDVKELEKLIDEYFEDCSLREAPYTMSGLAYWLGIDRRTLLNYSKDDLFFPLIKSAKEKVERQIEENALSGKANPTFSIFSLKNNYGWKDQQEQSIKHEFEDLTPLAELLKIDKDE